MCLVLTPGFEVTPSPWCAPKATSLGSDQSPGDPVGREGADRCLECLFCLEQNQASESAL